MGRYFLEDFILNTTILYWFGILFGTNLLASNLADQATCSKTEKQLPLQIPG
jgi:hypothetical protein